MFEKSRETVPTTIQGRSNLPSESLSILAARELGSTPLVTRSGNVSRLKTTTSMILRSQVRGIYIHIFIYLQANELELRFRK